MTDRIGCCIPGCRRTYRRDADMTETTRIMCGRHWKMADTPLLMRHRQLRRRCSWFKRKWGRRQNAIERSVKADKFQDAWRRAWRACNAAWERIRQDVEIKAAFGVEDAPKRKPRHDAQAGL